MLIFNLMKMSLKPLNIGIIGNSLAGLTAAYVLRQNDHRVTLLEHFNPTEQSAYQHVPSQNHFDAPFHILNPTLWLNTLLLAELLGINTDHVHTHMSCSWLTSKREVGKTWLKTGRLGGLQTPIPTHPRFNKYAPTLAWGIYRFKWALQKLREMSNTIDLQTWLQQQNLPPLFWHGCILPMLLTLCSCDVANLMKWPAKPLLHFCHVMLQGKNLYRLQGGTQYLVRALQTDNTHIPAQNIQAVWQEHQQVYVKNDLDQIHHFDHVIIATTHAQTSFLDSHQFVQERQLLNQLPYTEGILVNHTDTRLMPNDRQDWSILNYLMSPDAQQQSLTVWLNPIEAALKHTHQPLLQTWQSLMPIPSEHIISQTHLTRSMYTPESLHSILTLQQLQKQASPNQKRVWFCGAWFGGGLPILESAVTSAIDVCNQLGAAWPRLFEQDANSSIQKGQ